MSDANNPAPAPVTANAQKSPAAHGDVKQDLLAELTLAEQLIFEHLKSADVKTGDKSENAVFHRIDRLADADWLIILGFSFESDIESKSITTSQGQFQVTKVRMHDDLLQEGLL